MFEIGDHVIKTNVNIFEDDPLIPEGATGIVVNIQENGEYVGVSWDTSYNSDNYGNTYQREFFSDEDDRYITYQNVWFVNVNTLTPKLGMSTDAKTRRIITKIKSITEKVQSKRLPLRKMKKIKFPDLILTS